MSLAFKFKTTLPKFVELFGNEETYLHILLYYFLRLNF